MSLFDLRQALEMVKTCKYFFATPSVSQTDIALSEEMLGLEFSLQSKEFYSYCGYLSFEGNEIFGINPHDNSGILEGNSVAYALYERENFELPHAWLPVFNFNNGELAFLDYSDLNEEGEPPVITGYYDGSKYCKNEYIAQDLGAFLLLLVKNHLNR